MNTNFYAEPIASTDGKLLGCELLTKFHKDDPVVLNSKYFIMAMSAEEKCTLLMQQLTEIQNNSAWFREHKMFCTLNIDHVMARLCVFDAVIRQILVNLEFLRLGITEEGLDYGMNQPLVKALIKNGNHLFLNDLGTGKATALVSGNYRTASLDRAFYRHEVQKPTFEVLIKNLKKYCQHITVKGVDDDYELHVLRQAGIDAVQGYHYRSVLFAKVETLL